MSMNRRGFVRRCCRCRVYVFNFNYPGDFFNRLRIVCQVFFPCSFRLGIVLSKPFTSLGSGLRAAEKEESHSQSVTRGD